MRDLDAVIGRLLEVIPVDESELRARLVNVRASAGFRAPEMMHMEWSAGQLALQDRLGETMPEGGWEREVAMIWSGRA